MTRARRRHFVALTPTRRGYRLLDTSGVVEALGDAEHRGDLSALGYEGDDIVGMTSSDGARGYWVVGANGGVYTFGDAAYHGSLPEDGVATDRIVGMTSSARGRGYWIADRAGNVYPFGAVPFLGTLPGIGITDAQIVGIAATLDGTGYWLVDRYGGVYTFGAAGFFGSLPGVGIATEQICAIAASAGGTGYRLLSRDGNVYGFGSASCTASVVVDMSAGPESAVAIATAATGDGCWILDTHGRVWPFGEARFHGSARVVDLDHDARSAETPTLALGDTPDVASHTRGRADAVESLGTSFSIRLPVTNSSELIDRFAEHHVVSLADMVPRELLDRIDDESPHRTPIAAKTYVEARERVLIRSSEHLSLLGPATMKLFAAVGSPATLSWAEQLSRIEGLIDDPYLHEAGPFATAGPPDSPAFGDSGIHPLLGLVRRLTLVVITGDNGARAMLEQGPDLSPLSPGDLIVLDRAAELPRILVPQEGELRGLTWHYYSISANRHSAG